MKTIRQFEHEFIQSLQPLYDEDEGKTVTRMIVEKLTGMDRIQLSLNRDTILSDGALSQAENYRSALLSGKPIQYVLNEAWFFEMPLYVDENVLIPRPETEELVTFIAKDFKNKVAPKNVIDICSGSGCIALAMKKVFPEANVTGLDISEGALSVARKNAVDLKLDVIFSKQNVLSNDPLPDGLFDLIVSNPPYVRESEKTLMLNRVLLHEPHLALFVEDQDPLIFYKKIMEHAQKSLSANGVIYFEINEVFGGELAAVSSQYGFEVERIKDMFGKDRFLKLSRIR